MLYIVTNDLIKKCIAKNAGIQTHDICVDLQGKFHGVLSTKSAKGYQAIIRDIIPHLKVNTNKNIWPTISENKEYTKERF